MPAQAKHPKLPALPALPAKGEPVGHALTTWLYETHLRARSGDNAAANALIDVYQTRPELMDNLTALAHIAEFAWLDALTPKGTGTANLTRTVVERELHRLKDELAGGTTDPLEGLLIARIAAAWVALHYAEKLYAAGLATNGMAWAQIEHRARTAERMNRNFLRATEALAKVRRLRIGTVQVNIADKQINVAP
jgi:hypothetical protein